MPTKSPNHFSRATSRLIAIVCLVILVVAIDLSPIGGTLQFYGKWIACGKKPVYISGSGFLNDGVPHYKMSPTINILQGTKYYFCTAFEAEKHGYSATPDSYNFPVLSANEALCKKATDPEPETDAVFSSCEE